MRCFVCGYPSFIVAKCVQVSVVCRSPLLCSAVRSSPAGAAGREGWAPTTSFPPPSSPGRRSALSQLTVVTGRASSRSCWWSSGSARQIISSARRSLCCDAALRRSSKWVLSLPFYGSMPANEVRKILQRLLLQVILWAKNFVASARRQLSR